MENFLPRAARRRRQRRRRGGAWGCEVARANEGGRTGPVASTIGLARPLTYSTNQPPLPHWPGARGRLGHRRPSAVPGAPTGDPPPPTAHPPLPHLPIKPHPEASLPVSGSDSDSDLPVLPVNRLRTGSESPPPSSGLVADFESLAVLVSSPPSSGLVADFESLAVLVSSDSVGLAQPSLNHIWSSLPFIGTPPVSSRCASGSGTVPDAIKPGQENPSIEVQVTTISLGMSKFTGVH